LSELQGTFQVSWARTGEQHYQFVLQDKFLQATNKSVYPQQEKDPKGKVHEDLGSATTKAKEVRCSGNFT